MRKVVHIFIFVILSTLILSFYGCSRKSDSDLGSTSPAVTVKGKVNVQNVTIYISSIDSEGKLIKKVEVKTKSGKFEAKVPYSKKGGSFVFVADGGKDYIRATRTVKYKKSEDVDGLEVNLELLRLNSKQINVKDGLTITDAGKKYVRIRLDKGGIRSADKDNKKLIELNIPLELIKAQDTIEVRYRSFTPSDPQDYRFFPGEENESGERLLSVGFDYIDIVDPVTSKTVFDKTRIKQGQEVIRMLRWVDKEQLRKIKNKKGSVDEDPSKGGIQVTFYAFDSDKGAWVVAGKGIFVNSSSVNYTSQVFDNILQNGCANQQECDNNGVYWNEDDMFLPSAKVYAVVSITNPDLRWKNLDYIAPGNPAECEIVITDSKGNPVGTWVEASPDENGNIEYTSGFTSPSTGRTILRTITYGSPENGIISYYNPKNEWTISPICKETNSPVVKFVEGCRCTINIDQDKVCEVKGRVTDQNGNPLAYVIIDIEGTSFHAFATTDEQGSYSAKVPCNRDLNIYVNYSLGPFSFNVNGSVNGNENSDDGSVAVVDITLTTCYAEGRILFDGSPIEGVNILSATGIGPTSTDANGYFRVRVDCNSDETLYVVKEETTGPCNCSVNTHLYVKVDGTINKDETYDDGSVARLNDFDIAPCFVEGRFTDSNVLNKDLAGADVDAVALISLQNNRYYTSSMKTDNNGAYRLPILCGVESEIDMSYGVFTSDPDIRYIDKFKVDGSVNYREVSDDGKTVNMGTVDVAECKVTGSVTDQSSQPITGTTVHLGLGGDWYIWYCSTYPCMEYSDYTDSSGNYTLGTLCNKSGLVGVPYYSCNPTSPASFNVNGTVESPENGDDGTTVTLNFSNCQ